MPPKKQIEKDAILDCAFEMTKTNGYEALTARALAAALHCSTQPIYQAFDDMKALEKEVARRSLSFMLEQINTDTENMPQDLSFVLNYIRFALKETHLFRVIAQNRLFTADAQAVSSGIPSIDPKLIIFANGVVFMAAFQSQRWSWEEITQIVGAAYDDFHRGNA